MKKPKAPKKFPNDPEALTEPIAADKTSIGKRLAGALRRSRELHKYDDELVREIDERDEIKHIESGLREFNEMRNSAPEASRTLLDVFEHAFRIPGKEGVVAGRRIHDAKRELLRTEWTLALTTARKPINGLSNAQTITGIDEVEALVGNSTVIADDVRVDYAVSTDGVHSATLWLNPYLVEELPAPTYDSEGNELDIRNGNRVKFTLVSDGRVNMFRSSNRISGYEAVVQKFGAERARASMGYVCHQLSKQLDERSFQET